MSDQLSENSRSATVVIPHLPVSHYVYLTTQRFNLFIYSYVLQFIQSKIAQELLAKSCVCVGGGRAGTCLTSSMTDKHFINIGRLQNYEYEM